MTALRDYEPRIYQHSDHLLDKIKQSVGKPLDVTEWCSYFSFDVMGEFAFGRSFGMLEMGKPAEFPHLLRQSMVLIGLFSHLVWLLPIFKSFPILNAEWKKGWDMKRALIDERRKVILPAKRSDSHRSTMLIPKRRKSLSNQMWFHISSPTLKRAARVRSHC